MAFEKLQRALTRPGISLAVLFGSRAEGRARGGSDWDIGVLLDDTLDPDRVCAELEAVVQGRVDLVDLRRANPVLCMQVARHGRVLVDVSGDAWPSFVSLSLRRYEDNRKFRELQAQSLAAFVAQHERERGTR